nr:Flp pilus assembly complex ATPase component TadA [Lachnospiraceae bacterium]
HIERNGVISKYPIGFSSKEKLEDVIQQIVSKVNRIVNESNPIVDLRLMDGSRVNVVLPPIALNGPIVTIRKFPDKPFTMERLIEIGSITEEAASYLKILVEAGYNIFISGGTGSGKTTFLNALSNFIPNDERVITIEDSAELQLQNIDNLVRLEARNANVEGKNEVTIRDLVRSSLRMRPDRIVIGEIRDAAVIELLNAMNTGHDGSLSTGHANSCMDMLHRMETLYLTGMDVPLQAVRGQIGSAIDIIIQLGRLRDKSRKVLEIDEIIGVKDEEYELQTLFEFIDEGDNEDGSVKGKLIKTENKIQNTRKLTWAGKVLF